jgi:hypothetical protein
MDMLGAKYCRAVIDNVRIVVAIVVQEGSEGSHVVSDSFEFFEYSNPMRLASVFLSWTAWGE